MATKPGVFPTWMSPAIAGIGTLAAICSPGSTGRSAGGGRKTADDPRSLSGETWASPPSLGLRLYRTEPMSTSSAAAPAAITPPRRPCVPVVGGGGGGSGPLWNRSSAEPSAGGHGSGTASAGHPAAAAPVGGPNLAGGAGRAVSVSSGSEYARSVSGAGGAGRGGGPTAPGGALPRPPAGSRPPVPAAGPRLTAPAAARAPDAAAPSLCARPRTGGAAPFVLLPLAALGARSAPNLAAPSATAYLGWVSIQVGRSSASAIIWATSGIREEPPTSSTAPSSAGSTWAERSVRVSAPIVDSTCARIMSSN